MNSDLIMVGFGEVLWDLLPDGRQIGGSPLNVVYHCQATGIKSFVVSSIGDDQNGRDIEDILHQRKLSDDYLQQSKIAPTGLVTVALRKGIPEFSIHPDTAWDQIHWTTELKSLAQKTDALAFGSLPQRGPENRATLRQFIELMPKGSLRMFDINLRQNFHNLEIIRESLEWASMLKINDEELPILAEYLGYKKEPAFCIEKLMRDYDLQLIAYTKGESGSSLHSPTHCSELKGKKVKIKDTVGAGDAFTGVLIAGLLQGDSLHDIHLRAADIAAWVCENEGAMPEYRR